MIGAFQPRIAEEILRRRPDYRALSVTARGFSVPADPHVDLAAPVPPNWIGAHLEAWRAAFRGFGANPKRTPPSVDSLWKRLQSDGSLPRIDPVVDACNALSIRFGAPFGGEEADLYAGPPRLGLATGSEMFDTTRDGAPVVENPEQGEIVWYDDKCVTCRRWNWRQCRRTALSPARGNLWFVIDRLSPMPVEELLRAGEALAKGLCDICPAVENSISLLEPGE